MNANKYNYLYTLRKILDFQSNSTLRQYTHSIQYAHLYEHLYDRGGVLPCDNGDVPLIDYYGVAFSIEKTV